VSGRGKRYTSARSQIDRESVYVPLEAIHMLKEFAGAKFDETVEVHFRLGLNVRHADQQLRGTLMLPNGTGKNVRVAVFAEGEKAKEEGPRLAELHAKIGELTMENDFLSAALGRVSGPSAKR